MYFKILGDISEVETIARGNGIRDIARLKDQFGVARWRKLKGIATVSLKDGEIRLAEVHWYEAHGVGKVKLKIKHFLDEKA